MILTTCGRFRFLALFYIGPFQVYCYLIFFINDIFYFIEVAELLNFLDDNTIPGFPDNVENKITKLEEESSKAIKCLRFNEMIVTPVSSQSVV